MLHAHDMKKTGLILTATAMLLACASEPPTAFELSRTSSPAVDAMPAESAAAPDESGQAADGEWRVSLVSVRTAEQAAQLSRQIAAKGYRVETEEVEVNGTRWQRLVLPGYHSEAEARAMLPVVQQEFGMHNAWVPPRRKTEP